MARLIYVPSGRQNLKTKRLISPKCLTYRNKIFSDEMMGVDQRPHFNPGKFCQRHEQEMTQTGLLSQSRLNRALFV